MSVLQPVRLKFFFFCAIPTVYIFGLPPSFSLSLKNFAIVVIGFLLGISSNTFNPISYSDLFHYTAAFSSLTPSNYIPTPGVTQFVPFNSL